MKQKRYGPSLVTVSQPDSDPQQHVVLVTGGSSDGQELQGCEYYTPSSDRWRDTAQLLNEGRYQHASCTVNATVYVFCGYNRYKQLSDESGNQVSSIESLDVATSGMFRSK